MPEPARARTDPQDDASTTARRLPRCRRGRSTTTRCRCGRCPTRPRGSSILEQVFDAAQPVVERAARRVVHRRFARDRGVLGTARPVRAVAGGGRRDDADARDARRRQRALPRRRRRDARASARPHSHFYLQGLGTDPDRQGEGLASAAMQPVLDRCDREGIPAYLESTKQTQRRVLRAPRLRGHRVRATSPLGGPPLWLMWRDPEVVARIARPARSDQPRTAGMTSAANRSRPSRSNGARIARITCSAPAVDVAADLVDHLLHAAREHARLHVVRHRAELPRQLLVGEGHADVDGLRDLLGIASDRGAVLVEHVRLARPFLGRDERHVPAVGVLAQRCAT